MLSIAAGMFTAIGLGGPLRKLEVLCESLGLQQDFYMFARVPDRELALSAVVFFNNGEHRIWCCPDANPMLIGFSKRYFAFYARKWLVGHKPKSSRLRLDFVRCVAWFTAGNNHRPVMVELRERYRQVPPPVGRAAETHSFEPDKEVVSLRYIVELEGVR